jgi:hypothetical protein
MDPNTKIIREELEKKFAAMDLKWEQQFSEYARHKEERVEALESATADFKQWRPKVDADMEDVTLEIRKLSKQWERAVLKHSSTEPGLPSKPEFSMPHPGGGKHFDGPYRHRDDHYFRDQGHGSVTTFLPGPGKGMLHPPSPPVHTRCHG